MELEMKHTMQQKQTMSGKMLQSVQVLEMSADEMEDFLKDIAEKNPMVDLTEDIVDHKKELKSRWEWERQNDYQNASYYSADNDQEEREIYPSNFMGETLEEYLMAQLRPLCGTRYKERVFYYFVTSLNRQGYLDTGLDILAEQLHLTQNELEEYLYRVQACEPAGIAARDMRECLTLQLRRFWPQEKLAVRIVEECLELLGQRRFSSIAKKLDCSVDEIKAAVQIIYRLNPKPGNGFAEQENLQYVYPDVFVVRNAEGFEVRVNESAASRMNVNPYYLNLLNDEKIGRETIEYIRTKLEQVKWAVKCVDQRNSTLKKVAVAIVEWQNAFFDNGIEHLVPMRLMDIAEKVDLHVSTVSRAVKNKYIQCAYGVYPMSYFFSKTIGESTPEEVKRSLKRIIEMEDKKKPRSDQKIAELLEQEGCRISRRTVAKYRGEMGIPGTSSRKED